MSAPFDIREQKKKFMADEPCVKLQVMVGESSTRPISPEEAQRLDEDNKLFEDAGENLEAQLETLGVVIGT